MFTQISQDPIEISVSDPKDPQQLQALTTFQLLNALKKGQLGATEGQPAIHIPGGVYSIEGILEFLGTTMTSSTAMSEVLTFDEIATSNPISRKNAHSNSGLADSLNLMATIKKFMEDRRVNDHKFGSKFQLVVGSLRKQAQDSQSPELETMANSLIAQ